jgi:hypothetical protein
MRVRAHGDNVSGEVMADESPNFHHVVRLLRAMGPRYAMLAVYAAQFWSDEKLDDAEREGDLPGRPGEAKPKLTLVQ